MSTVKVSTVAQDSARPRRARRAPSAKKKAALAMMKERPDATIEEIAEAVGCSIASAWAWKQEWMERQAAGLSV